MLDGIICKLIKRGCDFNINFKGNENVHIILICPDGVRLHVQLILAHGKNGYEPLPCF